MKDLAAVLAAKVHGIFLVVSACWSAQYIDLGIIEKGTIRIPYARIACFRSSKAKKLCFTISCVHGSEHCMALQHFVDRWSPLPPVERNQYTELKNMNNRKTESFVAFTVGSKIIRALAIILATFLSFDCQFLSSHACNKQYKA